MDLLRSCGDNAAELSKIDTQFHIDISKACGNSLMPLLLEPIHRLIPEIKSSVYATVSEAKDSAIEWHQVILDQIQNGDSDGAQRAMHQHLKIAEEHAERMLNANKLEVE